MTTEALLSFIKEHRANEANFEKIKTEVTNNVKEQPALQNVLDNEVSGYIKMRELQASAWPEFEKFITACERVLNDHH